MKANTGTRLYGWYYMNACKKSLKERYNYWKCGVCLLCRDEGCPELASYLCRLDFVLADMMGMELKRTMTIADGGEYCDFRYKKKCQ